MQKTVLVCLFGLYSQLYPVYQPRNLLVQVTISHITDPSNCLQKPPIIKQKDIHNLAFIIHHQHLDPILIIDHRRIFHQVLFVTHMPFTMEVYKEGRDRMIYFVWLHWWLGFLYLPQTHSQFII